MGWIFSARCTSKARLDDKTAIVTGCNTGIGYYTVLDFYKRGGRVILACRSVEKAKEAAEKIQEECKDIRNVGQLKAVQLDLSSLKSVRACAKQLMEEEPRINILVNNAGIMTPTREVSEDGYEMQFATNHLGHFLLTLLLLPRIIKSAPARIINVSSTAHCIAYGINFDDINWEKSYSFYRSYRQTKLANILFTNELARRLEGTKVTVYSLHPGAVDTKMSEEFASAIFPGFWTMYKIFGYYFMKTAQQGAETTIYCAVDEKIADESGLYYDDCAVATPPKATQDEEMARKLWGVSEVMVGLGTNVTTYSLHPGEVDTQMCENFAAAIFPGVLFLYKLFGHYFMKTPQQGAETTIYCAVDEKIADETGLYYIGCAVAKPPKQTKDEEMARKLWEVSEEMVYLDSNNPFIEG